MHWIKNHRIVTSIICLVTISVIYWFLTNSQTSSEIRYITTPTVKGTLLSTVSGTGQVSVSDQVEISPKISGQVISVHTKNGQIVTRDTVLAVLDTRELQKAVRDAVLNLESAQISLKKLQQPADSLSVLQAQNALNQSERNLEDLKSPADELTLIQAENGLQNAKDTLEKLKTSQEIDMKKAVESVENAQSSLEKSYDNVYSELSKIFTDLPNAVNQIHNLLYGDDIGSSEASVQDSWINKTALINTLFQGDDADQLNKLLDTCEMLEEKSAEVYKNVLKRYTDFRRESNPESFDIMVNEAIETLKNISETAKYGQLSLNEWSKIRDERYFDPLASVEKLKTDISTTSNTINTHLTSLTNLKSTLEETSNTLSNSQKSLSQLEQSQPLDLKAAEQLVEEKTENLNKLRSGAEASDIAEAEANIREKQESLEKLKNGADALDIASQQLSVRQKQIALSDAQEKLDDASIKPPFDGVITETNLHVGDTLTSGTKVATILSQQKIAQISLNEVDIVKIQLDQKVTLSFDAIDGLNITGGVIDIDTLGTITQGVVTYDVTIGFDTSDDRVKPGMSVSAEIITDVRQDTLIIPSAAIKSDGEQQIVQILKNGSPIAQTVEIGISNDTSTEIISGIEEGQEVITSTIETSTTTNTTPSSSGLRIPGIGNPTGRNFRTN